LYFSLFSASFCKTFLPAGIATSISMHFSFFMLNCYIWPVFCNFSVCTAGFHNTVTSSCSDTGLDCVFVCRFNA
jgi:hypothetical protein